ncbi:MAG: enolase C-terminal domain-like protein, partial [Acidobacteriota bacterium]
GFAGVKIKVGSEDPTLDYERVEAVRRAVGGRPRLMIDANCRWDLNTALKWGGRMEALDLAWLEEPLDPFDIPGHAALAAGLTLPVMIGESITSLHVFRDYIAARAVDILQPDALKLGGISAWREAAGLARIHGLPVVPAVWDMMQVNAHLCATIPHVLMAEYIPWLLHIFKRPVRIEDGFLLAPDEPGIGTEIKLEAMEKYAVG